MNAARILLALTFYLLGGGHVLAEGMVATIPGYRYSMISTCGWSNAPAAVNAAKPNDAYAATCQTAEIGTNNQLCVGTATRSFSELGQQLSNWSGYGNGEIARFEFSSSTAYVYGNCPALNKVDSATSGITISREFGRSCPLHAHLIAETQCECDAGYKNDLPHEKCLPINPRVVDEPQNCKREKVGDPILPLTGSNELRVELESWLGEATSIAYDSRYRASLDGRYPFFLYGPTPSFGVWEGNFHKRLILRQSGEVESVLASRGSGVWIDFSKNGGVYSAGDHVNDQLSDAPGGGWLYRDLQRGVVENYDGAGRLIAAMRLDGASRTFAYSTSADVSATPEKAPYVGLLIRVSDQFERQTRLSYRLPGSVYEMVGPLGVNFRITFKYDIYDRLERIIWADGVYRQFLYGNPTFPWALTGVLDEKQAQTTTFGYDTLGRANDTQQAGGVNHYRVTYDTPPSWLVTDTEAAGANVI